MNRRTFVSMLGAAAPALAIPKLMYASSDGTNNPLVISTWEPNKKANATAWKVLEAGGTALDAVHRGVMVPEADPEDTSVGLGGFPDRDGHVTLDACIMDHQANIGAVMALEHIVHAISVARLVMEKSPHVQIVGEGALSFALQNGFKKQNLLTPKSTAAWKEWLKNEKYDPLSTFDSIQEHIRKQHDTIGMIAIDQLGNLSGACTTSGLAFKMHGRVGDSPIIGAGLFVDNEIGAASATGVGEEVVRICGSHTIVEAMRYGHSPKEACKLALERLVRVKGETYAQTKQIGFIAVNKAGETGCYSLLPNFTMALRTSKGEEVVSAEYLFEVPAK